MKTSSVKLFLAVLGLLSGTASAQMSYDSQEQVYTQSFDALPSSGSSFLWTDNSTLSGWYVGSSASSFNGTLGVSTGSTTTGNIYSFGLANATDRALGSIASGSTNFFYGLKAINNTATTITGFTISYTGEQWRNSAAAAQSLSFQYSIGATTLKNGNYVTVPMVGFSSPITGGTAGLLNGNLATNRVNVGPITVSNLNWLPGSALWLRFTDLDDAGFDHGLALDNFSFAAAGTAPAWDPPAGYYDAATGLTGEPLAAALHGIIQNNLVVPYSSTATTDTKAALKSLFEDPADPTKIILTYSGNSVLKTDTSWDRGRLWPSSRGIASTDNADTDLFNLRPSYSSINSARSNKLFDNSDWYDANYASPAAALAAADTSTDSNSWQPPASEVGDIARALFYMDVRYNGGDGNALDLALDNGIVNGSSMAVLSTLLQWSHDDPVSEEERKRNATIYSIYQHNRNPFVDHPEYVDSVFGYLVTEADDLDLDGLSNDWENAHQFNPTDAADANQDTDIDGFTNYEEYWMDSDPRDPASPARFLVDRASTASAQDGSLASPFKTIQAAINVVGANELRAIVVRPGIYPERPYANGKSIIHLFSEAGAAETIIDGQQVDSSVVRLYAFQKASFVGFTVRNAATSNFGAGLRIDAASGTILIANNILTANASTNTTAGGGGLYLKTAHHSRVINNFILGNTATRGGGVLFAGGDADFWFNTVAGNTATAGNGGGLSAMQGVHPDIRNNILWNNTGSAAAQLHQISSTYARDNIVQNAATGSGNLAADPLFIGNGDYHLAANSPAKDAAFALPVVSDFDGDARPGALGARDIGADEIVGSIDMDTDGLPDAWELQHFGNPDHLASADEDEDGLNNLQEYQQHTDPNDFYNGETPTLILNGGNMQSGFASEMLPVKLTVNVYHSNGTVPWSNAPVVFSTTSSGSFSTGASPAVARADSAGMAGINFLLPATAGSLAVAATAGKAPNTSTVSFTETVNPLPPNMGPITAQGNGTDIQIGWTPLPGASSYTVQRFNAANKAWETIGQPTAGEVNFSDPSQPPDTILLYKMSATDGSLVAASEVEAGIANPDGNGDTDALDNAAEVEAGYYSKALADEPPDTETTLKYGGNPRGWHGPDPKLSDTDEDGVTDDLDGWANNPAIHPPRLPEAHYAVIPLEPLGFPAGYQILELNDKMQVLAFSHPDPDESGYVDYNAVKDVILWDMADQSTTRVPVLSPDPVNNYHAPYSPYLLQTHRHFLNNNGVVCGLIFNAQSSGWQAATWSRTGGTVVMPRYNSPFLNGTTDLQTNDYVTAINDAGDVVGTESSTGLIPNTATVGAIYKSEGGCVMWKRTTAVAVGDHWTRKVNTVLPY